MRYTFPENYDTAPCFLVPINAALIPLVAGALKHFEERRSWHSDEEHQIAYNAFLQLESQMAACTLEELIESNNRLYRMLDTAIYGRHYVVVSVDPEVVIEPPLQATRLLAIEDDASILGRMEDLSQLLQNALNGTETPVYDRANGVRDLLEQIKTALEEQSNLDPEMLAQLVEIAGLLA